MPIPTGATDVTTAHAVETVAHALSPHSEIAVDVEADSMHHFAARLCFVQIGTETDIFLLDTLVPEVRAAALAAAFADETKTKYFHAAMGDLQYLAEAGVRVKGLFDTHRAATLLGRQKLGLVDLVGEMLGAKLAKEHQQSDFSIRPLPPELRAYIADDVRYLVEVGRRVKAECVEAGILEEVELDCARMADEAAERPDVAKDYRFKLPTQGYSPAHLHLAALIGQRLHLLRLKWAEAADLPMGRVLSNAAVVGIATNLPKSLRELARIEGVRGPFIREHGDEVMAVLRELTEQQARGELPAAAERAERDPRRRKREEALLDFRKAASGKRRVTPSVVLPNALVEELAARPPTSLEALALVPYFGKRRLALHGSDILAVLNALG